jgi:mannose-6-phosphate isomerase-like protein (cupin superfamily)
VASFLSFRECAILFRMLVRGLQGGSCRAVGAVEKGIVMTARLIAFAICAVALLCPGAAAPQRPNPGVRYFSASQVSAALAKGGALVERGGGNYAVLALHRDKAGEVEVHKRDVDIIYVVQGSAELVTGGSLIDARTLAQDEVRARSSSGGETRRVGKGDVVVIPPGIPHWFREVNAPFEYPVVKVQ